MNKLTKKQLLIGGIMLLVAINLAALATIIYQNQQFKDTNAPVFQNDTQRSPGSARPTRRGRNMSRTPRGDRSMGRFEHHIQNQLNLDSQQFEQFQKMHRQNRNDIKTIAQMLEEKRSQMMLELSRKEPDTAKLNTIANEIGALHTRLKQSTINHFMEMKQLCRPDQREKLNELIRKMESTHRQNPGPRGSRHGGGPF